MYNILIFLPNGKNKFVSARLLPSKIYEINLFRIVRDTEPSSFDADIIKHNCFIFNYRPVLLYTKPRVYIEDITIKTSISGETGLIKYIVQVNGANESETVICTIIVREADGTAVSEEITDNFSGTIKVPNAKLWWPRGMSPITGYLYTFEVTISVGNSTVCDIYRLPIGIRTLKWTNTSLLLNDKPVYMRGFGRHEDSVLRGRGLDLVTMTRDYELLKWVGANAYRTSHYPYSDEVMDMADRQGFLIIDECPSVDTENFTPSLLTLHKTAISELIRRDKNRPSVIAWSIANEPRTQLPDADEYFKEIARHTKTTDPTRPITAALARGVGEDRAGQYLDIISFNRYNSWYHNTGRLDMITDNVIDEAEAWNNKYNKPVLMSEYGADTMPGLHEVILLFFLICNLSFFATLALKIQFPSAVIRVRSDIFSSSRFELW